MSTHHHGHSHDHHHGHQHGVAPKNWNKAFIWGAGLNLLFVFIEALYGYWANSLSLIADAGHNLSDVLGLGLAFGAYLLSQKRPSTRFTYGFKSSTILASLTNAVILLVAVGGILLESFRRFNSPENIQTTTVMVVAFVGVIINGLTAMFFFSGQEKDLNIRGAFLHMVADALISLGVVVSAYVISKTGWVWMDPAISIAIALTIVWSTWHLLRESLDMALGGVPSHIETIEVKNYLQSIPGVSQVHDLHIWSLSTTDVALTAHLVMPEVHQDKEFLKKVSCDLKEKFEIHHSTIQVEAVHPQNPCCSLEK